MAARGAAGAAGVAKGGGSGGVRVGARAWVPVPMFVCVCVASDGGSAAACMWRAWVESLGGEAIRMVS